jgi:hypothetical protein
LEPVGYKLPKWEQHQWLHFANQKPIPPGLLHDGCYSNDLGNLDSKKRLHLQECPTESPSSQRNL